VRGAPAKGVIFVRPRGAPVVSIIRWIDIHIGSCSARNTPLVGGNAPSAERDKRGRRQLGNAARGAETCMEHSRPRNKGEIHQALNYAKSCVGFSPVCVPDPIKRPSPLTSLSRVCSMEMTAASFVIGAPFLMPRAANALCIGCPNDVFG
jgi:hypothetical protein